MFLLVFVRTNWRRLLFVPPALVAAHYLFPVFASLAAVCFVLYLRYEWTAQREAYDVARPLVAPALSDAQRDQVIGAAVQPADALSLRRRPSSSLSSSSSSMSTTDPPVQLAAPEKRRA